MILTEKVEIKIVNSKIREYYKNAGYNTENYKIFVLVKDLLKNSHVLVDVKCDICGHEKNLKYSKYIKNYSKYQIYACSNLCAQVKNKMTSIQNFGVEHHSKTKEHREKVSEVMKGNKKITHHKTNDIKYENRKCLICDNKFYVRIKHKKLTCSKICYLKMTKTDEYRNLIKIKTQLSIIEKYGVSNQYQREDVIQKLREIRINKGIEIHEDKLTEWMKYKRIVNKITVRNKKKIYENWDGYDYYDGEYIKNNLLLESTNSNYPNIDHKISIFYGFKNNIEPEEISKLENLCITKRKLNIKKRTMCEEEFINSL